MEEYEWKEQLLYRRGKIVVPDDEEANQLLMELYHDSLVAGHPGQAQTLELVNRAYHWPNMKAYINRYVSACDPCQRTKVKNTKPTGTLQSLPVPEEPWQAI